MLFVPLFTFRAVFYCEPCLVLSASGKSPVNIYALPCRIVPAYLVQLHVPVLLQRAVQCPYFSTASILLARSFMSQKSATRQCFITSETPLCFDIRTGVPAFIASSAVIPKGSETEGIT